MTEQKSGSSPGSNMSRKWNHLRKVLERPGPFCTSPSAEALPFLQTSCKVLIIGAGGLGCELLKDIALMGFNEIHVIDMDTIDLSNLNRQFLFRQKDIGSSKAEVAAKFINSRIPGVNVIPHFCKIQDYDSDFYQQFHIIVCGLDSIVARRWINGMLLSLLQYEEDGTVDQSTIIPMVDGGTEGFKGNARVILPGMSACIDCTLDLFPPQVTYPLCTIASTPRLPEHCIEYVKVIQWTKENPFDCPIDGDDPNHINWIYEKATERANQFNIGGITYRLVQGVIKNIIPAVASTNAVIAATCAAEVFKLATGCATSLNNYMVFNDVDGIYTYTYEAERKPNCLACGPANQPKYLDIESLDMKLSELIELLSTHPSYQMKAPGLTTVSGDGKNRTLYMSTVRSIEEATRENLKRTLTELELRNESIVNVADSTTPNTLEITLRVTPKMME
ncbi:hypothetical protein WDU94_006761 [Cyamophila willieti]